MSIFAKLVVALVCLAGTFVAPIARADIPPVDACSTEGTACQNAGGDGGQPGVCSVATCTRSTGQGGADGVISYECLLCKKGHGSGAGGEAGASGGTAGTGAAGADAGAAAGDANTVRGGAAGEAANGGAAAATGAAGSPAVPPPGDGGDDGGCGCTFKALGSERGVVALMLGIGLAALHFSRRRR